jgi:peroxin-3
LRQLLDETSDLIESPSFSRILTALNNEGFATLIEDKCAKIVFKSPATSEPATAAALSSTAPIVPPPSPKAKLATILALITREAHVIGHGTSSPNEYLSVMEQNVRDLEAFAAVVYSSNFQLELLHSGDASSPSGQQPSTAKSSTALQSTLETISPEEALESQPAGEDSAFEKVWGKAVENSESTT